MISNEIVVSICCITYNHAPYIRQCLDGFIMQQTDFAFEVLIHDDASTDGTTEIIKEYEAKYPNIIKPIYEEVNQWVKGRRGSAVFNFPRANGKYISMCEGDDYWTDPLKLQKQVSFLEKHHEYVFCCHGFSEKGLNAIDWCRVTSESITLDKFIRGDVSLITLSILFRRSDLSGTKYWLYKYHTDISLYYALLTVGDGFYIADVMGTYRKHHNSVWASVTNDAKWLFAFSTKYDILKNEDDENAAKYMYLFLLQNPSRKGAIRCIRRFIKSLKQIYRHLGGKCLYDIVIAYISIKC